MSRLIEQHIVPEGLEAKRLSDYAKEVIQHIPSAKGIKKAIKRGELRVNGQEAHSGDWVQAGQVIELYESEDRIPSKPFNYPLEIVFEDDHLAVIHKPAGLVVSGNLFRTVENAAYHQVCLSQRPDALAFPRPVHRLDRFTSGLLLFAKTRSARMELGHQFEEKRVEKIYRAVVLGRIKEKGELTAAIDGKEAYTAYERLDCKRSLRNEWLSLVELYPATGRTHQLRIHLSDAGHPILGDALYGEEGKVLKGKGLFLAAVGLDFAHPFSGEKMSFSLPTPAKFEKFMLRAEERWQKYREEKAE